jgi:hypothetical protein
MTTPQIPNPIPKHQKRRCPDIYSDLSNFGQPPDEHGRGSRSQQDFKEFSELFGIRKKGGDAYPGQRIVLASHQDIFQKFNLWVTQRRYSVFIDDVASMPWSDERTPAKHTMSLCDVFSACSIHAFDQDIRFTGSWTPQTDNGEIENLVMPLIDAVKCCTRERPLRFVVLIRQLSVIDDKKKFGLHCYCPDLILTREGRNELNRAVNWMRIYSGFHSVGNMTFDKDTRKNHHQSLFDIDIRGLRMICSKKNSEPGSMYRYWKTFVLERRDEVTTNKKLEKKFNRAFKFSKNLSARREAKRIKARKYLLRLTSLFRDRRLDGDTPTAVKVEHKKLKSFTTHPNPKTAHELKPEKKKPEKEEELTEDKEENRELIMILRTITGQVLNEKDDKLIELLRPSYFKVGKGSKLKYKIRFTGSGPCMLRSQRMLSYRFIHHKSERGNFGAETIEDNLRRIWGSGRPASRHTSGQTEITVEPGHVKFTCFAKSCGNGKSVFIGFDGEAMQKKLFKTRYETKAVTTIFNDSEMGPASVTLANRVLAQNDREESGDFSINELIRTRLYNR